MLVLSRRKGETVVVGGGGGVKLGFDVDRDIPVHREEVWQRMCASGELQEGIDFVKPT